MKKKTLLVVESPAKAKTIERYLGAGYKVSASMGHLIDLPKSRLAVDLDNDFEPEYITVRGKAKILKELIAMAKKSDRVFLASDNDREGEAIAYHLRRAIREKNKELTIKRIVFNEITPTAIREAVKKPLDIDEAKVNAQKARRVLDRLVGYNLSPLLWQKVKNGLSAGRVQSVALRLICDREKEVEEFIPEEYWTLDAEFGWQKHSFSARLALYDNKKPHLGSQKDVQEICDRLKDQIPVVSEVKVTEKSTSPRPPYTTSKLQQEAANRLGFTSRKTMQIAQQLYEGIDLGSGRSGIITYMRTDSTRVSAAALEQARAFIAARHPAGLPATANYYSQSQGSQDAHEAIRPTEAGKMPETIKSFLNRDQFKLYSLIWERFISSQMKPSVTSTTNIDVAVEKAVFRASSSKLKIPGWQAALKVLKVQTKSVSLPALKKGDEPQTRSLRPEQRFTSGPARFTDATIIKTLEEKGIGRPSTYAPIVSVLLDRYYAQRRNKQLTPTALGRIINDILVGQFPNLIETGFTADMEKHLDQIEEENMQWRHLVRDFYLPFKDRLEEVSKTIASVKGALDEPTDQKCEKCDRMLVKKLGRFGFFLACSGFPECRFTKPLPLADCPRPGCKGKIVARKKSGGRGKEFYGCTNYPECDFLSHYKPTNSYCPECGRFLVEKHSKKDGETKVCVNPQCKHLHSHSETMA